MPRCRYPSPGRSLCLASRGSSSVSVIPVVFMMVDAIAKAKGISINTVNFKAQIGKGNVPVMLAKPQTFMNSSGESVGAIVSYYKIPLKQVLVIFVHP
ncbi:hypothetical protein ES332_A07G136600v1 [Gossypium tomentosum]|uniref:Uncharacterized protein n=1 Tax=Gossypium tomentosum TaxID=34277 RepID=A0A5D2PV52_GOSTO|nr:hypothetical protein ES332_A07G136600v1 [Gossypium tomentosum]